LFAVSKFDKTSLIFEKLGAAMQMSKWKETVHFSQQGKSAWFRAVSYAEHASYTRTPTLAASLES
jgi:hypothetical protein